MNADDYETRGCDFQRAFELLADHMLTPPSLEVFEAEFAFELRRRPCLSPITFASELVLAYRPVPAAFEPPDYGNELR